MTSTFEVFKNLGIYTNFNGSLIWNFKSISFKNNKCIVKLDKYFSRDDVQNLKGEKIYSDKKFFPKIKDREFYVNDLIGCKVYLKNRSSLGEVLDIKNFGAGDLLEVIIYNKKTILIPFNQTNIISVSLSKKEIIADPIKGIL